MEDSGSQDGVSSSGCVLSNYKRQLLAAIVASLGSFGLGNVFGWTSPALPDLMNDWNITSAESSWIASLAILGALLSGPISGLLINRIGRKILMLIMALPFTLGWGLMAFANNVPMLYAGRILTGFAGGSFTVTIQVYVSEIAADSIRGTLGSIMVLTIVSGILFTYAVGTIVSWSGLSLICTGVPILFFCAMLFMPESPKYLLSKGKINQARDSFKWLMGSGNSLDVQEQVDLELAKAKTMFKGGREEATQNAPYIKQLLVAGSLFVFQQFSGINGIMMFTVAIFKSAGTPLTPNMSSIVIGIVQVVFVFISLIVVDKIGRKFLLLGSDIVMGSSFLAMGIFYYVKDQNGGNIPSEIGWIPLASVMTFVIAYSIGAGPLPWLLMSELLPPRAQGFGSSILASLYWILAFLSALTFEDHFYHYWIFSGICFGGGIFTYFFVPETKGKTQEEIQKHFGVCISTGNELTEDAERGTMIARSQCSSIVDMDNNIKAEKCDIRVEKSRQI